MATNIALLSLVRVSAGVEVDEDWIFTLNFFQFDGITPLVLTGITLTIDLFSDRGILYAGPMTVVANSATISVLAPSKAAWLPGVYSLSLLATDGTNAREVFGYSTLTVGAPQIVVITPLNGSAGGISIFGGITTAAGIAAALATLPASTLLPLVNALILALPDLFQGGVAPASGLPMFNLSEFLVKNT